MHLGHTSVPSPTGGAFPDDSELFRRLARLIFEIGFQPEAIRRRWPAFEQAFLAFDPAAVSAFAIADVDRLCGDATIIRNRMRIAAVIDNARCIVRLAATHGSFGAFLDRLRDEPYERRAGCLMELFTRVGPRTAYAYLREHDLADESDAPEAPA